MVLHPNIPINDPDELIVFDGSNRSSNVVLLRYNNTVTIFDLETKDIHRREHGSIFLEIDLPSRLENMKIFS